MRIAIKKLPTWGDRYRFVSISKRPVPQGFYNSGFIGQPKLHIETKKNRPHGAAESVFNIDNWIYSGDDLLFRGLSQSTIGDTGFPCLVRDGTEGGSRSIITRINPANIIIQVQESLVNVLFKHSSDKSQTIR